MWSRLEDELFDHRKIIRAGQLIGGSSGIATALGFYTAGILYSNKHLTDGFLPAEIVRLWPHAKRPLQIARALEDARLWESVEGGWQIHDFAHHNFSGEEVKRRRAATRERKQRERDRKERARRDLERHAELVVSRG